jgi:hypothetical protein
MPAFEEEDATMEEVPPEQAHSNDDEMSLQKPQQQDKYSSFTNLSDEQPLSSPHFNSDSGSDENPAQNPALSQNPTTSTSTPSTLTPLLTSDSSRTVHFLHGTTVIPTANVPLAVRTAALEAIAWWKGGPRGNPKVTTRLAINRLGKPIQKTDGVGYSCDRCRRKHLVCVRRRLVSGGAADAYEYLAYANKDFEHGQIVWM